MTSALTVLSLCCCGAGQSRVEHYGGASGMDAGYTDSIVLSAESDDGSIAGMLAADFSSSGRQFSSGTVPSSQMRLPKGPMMQVEASVRVEVKDVEETAKEVRALARSVGGRIVRDEVLADRQSATFILRVPPEKVDAALEGLAEMGTVLLRRITAKDVTKQFVDNRIKLDNLNKALTRYQEILATADVVKDVLQIERELTRIRGEIEKIKGEQKYLRDKVALATLTVFLVPEHEDASFAPRAKFHPGVRYGYLASFAKKQQAAGFYGPGFSLHVRRWLTMEVDILSKTGESAFRADAIATSLTSTAYSDFLGRGRRRWLNPYFGLAFGFLTTTDATSFSAGGALGVELFKTKMVLVDASIRAAGLFGNHTPRLAVQTTLGVNVAF